MVERYPIVDRNGVADQIDGQIAPTRLVGDHPEEMQAVSMAGVGRKHMPVEAFGVVQASSLVILNGIRK